MSQCDFRARDLDDKMEVHVHCLSKLDHEGEHNPGPPAVSAKPLNLGPWLKPSTSEPLMRDFLEGL